jgi:hypothetical protein
MMTNDKENGYKTVPDGAYYYGVTIVSKGVHRLMMWADCLGAEGTDQEVKLTFRLFDVTVKGSGLLQLLRDAKRHKIDVLAVAPRHHTMLGGEGMIVTAIEVEEATT